MRNAIYLTILVSAFSLALSADSSFVVKLEDEQNVLRPPTRNGIQFQHWHSSMMTTRDLTMENNNEALGVKLLHLLWMIVIIIISPLVCLCDGNGDFIVGWGVFQSCIGLLLIAMPSLSTLLGLGTALIGCIFVCVGQQKREAHELDQHNEQVRADRKAKWKSKNRQEEQSYELVGMEIG